MALQAVVQSGTGTAAALYNRPAAGKTGTTNNNVDAWFNGFTPQLETTVWMGNVAAEVPMLDVGGVGQVYGGTFPAHTWHDFMSQVLGPAPVVPFTPPNFGALPAPKFITSPALVHDDALDHNFGYTHAVAQLELPAPTRTAAAATRPSPHLRHDAPRPSAPPRPWRRQPAYHGGRAAGTARPRARPPPRPRPSTDP